MPRLRIQHSFAAIAVLLATALSACGGGSSDEPQDVIDNATLQGIESGKIDLAVKFEAEGEEGGNLDLSLSGPFQGQGQGALPVLNMQATAKGKVSGDRVDFAGGLVLLPESAFVNYEGTDYEVDPTTFGIVESAIQQGQREAGGEGEAGDTTACQEEIGELRFREFVDDAKDEGEVDVGGESTTKVNGSLDVAAALDQLAEIAQSPACSTQASAAGELPSDQEIDEAKKEVREAVKSAEVDLYVGDDDIVRRLAARFVIEPEDSGSGPREVKFNLDMRLTDVNEEQQIAVPGEAEPLNDLFLELGVNPIELLDLLQGKGQGVDFGRLLEDLGAFGDAGGGSGGGRSSLDCLEEARSPTDLQRCTE